MHFLSELNFVLLNNILTENNIYIGLHTVTTFMTLEGIAEIGF